MRYYWLLLAESHLTRRLFGIYGNAVVDHGYSLMSDVSEGQEVARGDTLGRKGETGFGGLDQLHFATLLHGGPVNPVELWNNHWIEDRLRLKLVKVLKGYADTP